VVRELEGKTLQRKILTLDDTTLVLYAGGSDPSKRTTIHWKKIKNL